MRAEGACVLLLDAVLHAAQRARCKGCCGWWRLRARPGVMTWRLVQMMPRWPSTMKPARQAAVAQQGLAPAPGGRRSCTSRDCGLSTAGTAHTCRIGGGSCLRVKRTRLRDPAATPARLDAAQQQQPLLRSPGPIAASHALEHQTRRHHRIKRLAPFAARYRRWHLVQCFHSVVRATGASCGRSSSLCCVNTAL